MNFYVILEALKNQGVTLLENASVQDASISSMRRIRASDQKLDSVHLYICSSEEYYRAEKKQSARYFAVSGEILQESIIENDHHILLFPKGVHMDEIEDKIQDIIDDYEAWYDRTVEAIRRGAEIQEVFNLAVTVLKFPVALFDKHSILLAKAGQIPENLSDTVWEDVLSDRHFPSDEVSPVQTRQIYEHMMKNQWPVLYHSRKHKEYHLTCALFLKERYFGILGTASRTAFSQGQIALYWQVKKIMEWTLLLHMQLSGQTDGVPYFIERMLSGYNIEEDIVLFQLHTYNWKMNDEYMVVCMKSSDGGRLYENDCQRFMAEIREIFPMALTFWYEGSITSIVRILGNLQQNKKGFLKCLEKNGLRAGISLRFRDFMHLEYAYIQCKHALLYGSETITEFSQIYSLCLVKTLEQATSLKSMCHPEILRYWQQGGEKEKVYIHCLKVYLQNGRNLTDTAQKLSVHRNTLIYRIDQMGKLLEIDLRGSDISDDMLSLLITSCEITEYFSA